MQIIPDRDSVGRRRLIKQEVSQLPEPTRRRWVYPFTSSSNFGEDSTWNTQLDRYLKRTMLWEQKYHQRSKIESFNYSIKIVASERLRSRTFAAQTCELLMKIVCSNLSVLIKHYIKGEIEIDFLDDTSARILAEARRRFGRIAA